jgi:hypothetical protein
MRLLRRMVCFFDLLIVTSNNQRLYCCLLFFFNFFQYVKELSEVSSLKFKVQSITTFYFWLSTLYFQVENNGVEPLTSCVQGRRSSQLS